MSNQPVFPFDSGDDAPTIEILPGSAKLKSTADILRTYRVEHVRREALKILTQAQPINAATSEAGVAQALVDGLVGIYHLDSEAR